MPRSKYDDGTRPPALEAGVEIVSVASGPLYTEGDRLLYDVYRAAGFCEPSERSVVEELVQYTHGATFHLAVFDGEVFGTTRTTVAPLERLQIGTFDVDPGVETDRVCEWSSLALAPSKRGSGVVESLYRAGWMAALRADASWLAAMVDPWLMEVLCEHYLLPFVQIGAPKSYMGGDSVVPAQLPLDGGSYATLAERAPGFWDWVLEEMTADEVARWGMPDPRGVHELNPV